MNLLKVEMRRALHRRAVWVLILVAVAGCAFAGVIAFTSSSGKTLAELHFHDEPHPAIVTDWWIAARSDGVILIASIFLLLGASFAGAAVAGGEWRAGTITTVLTWEPRRVRLHLARTAACGIIAFFVGLALQVFFLACFLPAAIANGSTSGTDAQWWLNLAMVITRAALLTSVAAMVAVALATLGRNTAFALAVLFAWMAVIEGIVRGMRPEWAGYLWGENIATVVPWTQMNGVPFTRGPLLALGTIVVYAGVLIGAATLAFRRRDVSGAG